MKTLLNLLLMLLACISTHAQQWRLVEYLVQDYDLNDSVKYVTVDSTRYIYDYINGRGGKPGERIQYNVKWHYEYVTSASALVLRSRSGMVYHANNNFFYDEVFKFNGNIQKTEIDSYIYTNGVLSYYISNRYHPPTPNVLYGYYRESYNYDASGNLLSNVHSYTGAPGMSWMPSDAYRYRYDGNNRLIADSALFIPQLTPHTLNYYSYDNNGRLDKKYRLEPSTYDTLRTTTYFYNASGKLYMDSLSDDNTKQAIHRNRYYYDQNDLLVRVDAYDGQDANRKKYSKVYQYEIYWPANVANTRKRQLDVQVFPNPAINTIDIKTVFSHPQKIQLSITDMQGRVLRKWTEQADKNYETEILLHGFTQGIYILHLEGKETEAYKQFIVQ